MVLEERRLSSRFQRNREGFLRFGVRFQPLLLGSSSHQRGTPSRPPTGWWLASPVLVGLSTPDASKSFGERLSVSSLPTSVNPKDYRQFLVPDMDDIRIPLWGIDIEKNIGRAGKLELFWSPDTQLSRLPVAGSEFSFFGPTSVLPTTTTYVKPVTTVGDSRIGLRYSWLSRGWDSSLFYLHSIDDLPATSTALVPSANPTISIVQRYPQLDNFAATTSKPLGDFVFKAEAIYSRGTQYESTTLGPPLGRDTVSGMIGFSHSLCCQYLLDVQYFQTSLTANASRLYQPGFRDGMSVRIADVASLRRIKPSIQAVFSTNQHDYWISPKVAVRVTSSLFATFGFDWFGGGHETLFGQFHDASRLELSLFWKAK